jgi:hypothetical protein
MEKTQSEWNLNIINIVQVLNQWEKIHILMSLVYNDQLDEKEVLLFRRKL